MALLFAVPALSVGITELHRTVVVLVVAVVAGANAPTPVKAIATWKTSGVEGALPNSCIRPRRRVALVSPRNPPRPRPSYLAAGP